MANETELEKIDRAAEYFERYFEFEDAVTVSKENCLLYTSDAADD